MIKETFQNAQLWASTTSTPRGGHFDSPYDIGMTEITFSVTIDLKSGVRSAVSCYGTDLYHKYIVMMNLQ